MSVHSRPEAEATPPRRSRSGAGAARDCGARAVTLRAGAILALALICPSSGPARAGKINSRPATLVEVRRDGVRINDPEDVEGRWGTKMDVVINDRDNVQLLTEFDGEPLTLQLRSAE